ncbi:MAG TPA: MG2 domain-containing protein, partial [Verrucomicrobiales bacterium]|nr:MG2 domain-containing protein [Verrucomicrobiales bacterium]
MKCPPVLSLLAFVSSLSAAPIDDAASLLQSKKYPEAAAAFAALPPDAGEKGQAPYLHALSLHLAGKPEDALKASDAVPADSPWGTKAKFLKAVILTKAKKHREAEAIYAAEAARAFSQPRRDALVKTLLEFAEEAANPVSAGEVTPPQPDWKKATALCEKVLDMPITAELRADVLFRKAMLFHKAKDYKSAEGTFNAWLLLFDPDWSLALEPGKKNDQAKLTGKPRAEARLHLAENLLALGRTADAVAVANDLSAMLKQLPADSPDKPMAGDAAWLRVRTFAPQPAQSGQQRPMYNNDNRGQQQMEQNVLPLPGARGAEGPKGSPFEQFANLVPFPARGSGRVFSSTDYLTELRRFLKDYPAHKAAPEAAAAIAQTLDNDGKDTEAVAAWADFIAAKDFKFDPAAEANRKQDAASGMTPAEALVRRQQSAAFRIGQIHASKRRYAEAITQWQKYITAYPNGAEWQQAQSGIVDAEFQTGITAVAAGDEKKAREVFDAFLTRYPLDARARQILFIYGQMRYAAAQQMKEKKAGEEETKAEFQKAIDEWSRLTGKYPDTEESSLALYNTGLILTEELTRLDDGLAVFKRLKWGQWAGPAKERAALLESKSLAVAAPRVFRSNETPQVAVSVRNLPKLRVSRYPLDLEAWFRRHYSLEGIEKLDVDLIAPEKTWELEVKDFARYRAVKQDIEIPFPDNKPGACIVRVESDNWQATTLVLRSDLELISESTRREALAFVLNARENKPAAGVTVLVSDGSAILTTGQTGADGIFKTALTGNPANARLFLLSPSGMAASHLDMSSLNLTKQRETATYATFDRESYLPGQTVHYHLLRRTVKDGIMAPAAAQDFTLRVLDPASRLVTAGPSKWEAGGTLTGTFTVPNNAPSGEYSIQLLGKDEKIFQRATFNVEETPVDDKPVITVKLTPGTALPGEKIKVEISAEWPWGVPVTNEPVEVRLPFVPLTKLRTDAEGHASFEFTAEMPAALEHDCGYESGVSLPRLKASAEASYIVARRPWTATFLTTHNVIAANDPATVRVKARSHDSKPVAQKLHFALVKLAALPPSRVLEGVPWLTFEQPAPVESVVEEFDETSRQDNGIAEHKLTIAAGGHYILRMTGGDKAAPVKEEQRFYVSAAEDVAGLRFYSDTTVVNEGAEAVLRLHSLKAHPQVLLTAHADGFLSQQVMALAEGFTEIKLPVTAAHAPNFRVTAATMDGQLLRTASIPLNVRQGLLVSFSIAEGSITPGAPVPLKLTITDLAGKPVADAATMIGMEQLHAEPDADLLVRGESQTRTLFRTLTPRALRLSLHSTAALTFPGVSARVTVNGGNARGQVEVVLNDQEVMCRIQGLELGNNRFNGTIALRNSMFEGDNYFLTGKQRAKTGGPFVFSSGVKTPRDPLAGTPGLALEVPDADSEVPPADPYGEAAVSYAPLLNEDNAIGNNAVQAPAQVQVQQTAESNESAAGDCDVWVPSYDPAQPVKGPSEEGVWRAIVRVVSPSTGVMETSAQFIVKKPLVVRAWLPKALQKTDKVRIPVTLINRDRLGGEATLMASSPWFADGGRATLRLDGQPPLRALLPLKTELFTPLGVRSLLMMVSAQAQAFSDSQSTDILWRTWIPQFRFYSRIAKEGDNAPLIIPAEDGAGREVEWALFADGRGLVSSLAADTSKGQEDPAGQLLAITAALRMKAGDETELRRKGTGLISALALAEKDGGWSWGGLNVTPDIITTALTWHALTEAKASGFTVSDKLKERVERYMSTAWTGIAADDYEKKACVLHTLAAAGKADYANAAPLLRARDSLTSTAAAWLAAALIRMERTDEAGQLLDLLEAKAERKEGSAKQPVASWPGSTRTARLGEREQVASLALWSMSKLRRENPLAAATANWLLESRVVWPDGGSMSRGFAAAAFAEWHAPDAPAPGGSQASVATGNHQLTARPGSSEFSNPARQRLNEAAEQKGVFGVVKGFRPMLIARSGSYAAPDADPKPWAHPQIASRQYLHDTLVVDDRPVDEVAGTSPVTKAEWGQRVRVEVKMKSTDAKVAGHSQYIVWDEPLPGGCLYVPGSAKGNFNRVEELPGALRLTYAPGVVQNLSYEMVALATGEFTVPPSILRDAYDSAKYRPGPAGALTVLAPGEKSPEPYQMNTAEHYVLAKRTFADGQYDEALKHLEALAGARDSGGEMERETAKMRLWILADRADGDAKAMIGAFELLTERYPQLVIPFDKLLKVGTAYRKLNEFERAATVYRAALDGAFVADSSLGATLEDQGDYAGSTDLQEKLWREYPDSRDVMDALIGLAQGLASKAPDAEKLPVRRGQKKLEKNALLTRSRDLLQRYVTVYPADDMADDAAFSMVNVFFSLKDYAGVVQAATAGAERYAGSTFADSFRYMAALGHFWLGAFDKALAAAAPVANGESKDRDYARYVTAQVYHAQGNPADAITWYQKVKALYPDAADAINWFEEKRVSLPEVTIFKPGGEVKVTLDYRNVKEAALQLYKVDLMKLYLREKSLSNITQVNLAGIQPLAGETMTLGEGKDYAAKQKVLTLPVKEEGAYLVILRGDNLFTSGLVLVSPLKLEVKEN